MDIIISGYIFTTSISAEAIANLTELNNVLEASSGNYIKYESHEQRQKQKRRLNGMLVN